MKAPEVITALRRHYGSERDVLVPEWALLDEFQLGTGPSLPRIDLFAVRAWRGKRGHERHAIEVKVSRSDFLSELKKPSKRRDFVRHSHRFYFATPAKLVKPEEIPPECGLLEIHGTRVHRKIAAPHRSKPAALPEGALAEAMRRASRAEGRIANAQGTGDILAEVAYLRDQLSKAEAQQFRAAQSLGAEKRRVKEFVDLIGMYLEVPCKCGEALLMPRRGDRFGRGRWAHVEGKTCRYPGPDYEMATTAQ